MFCGFEVIKNSLCVFLFRSGFKIINFGLSWDFHFFFSDAAVIAVLTTSLVNDLDAIFGWKERFDATSVQKSNLLG